MQWNVLARRDKNKKTSAFFFFLCCPTALRTGTLIIPAHYPLSVSRKMRAQMPPPPPSSPPPPISRPHLFTQTQTCLGERERGGERRSERGGGGRKGSCHLQKNFFFSNFLLLLLSPTKALREGDFFFPFAIVLLLPFFYLSALTSPEFNWTRNVSPSRRYAEGVSDEFFPFKCYTSISLPTF